VAGSSDKGLGGITDEEEDAADKVSIIMGAASDAESEAEPRAADATDDVAILEDGDSGGCGCCGV